MNDSGSAAGAQLPLVPSQPVLSYGEPGLPTHGVPHKSCPGGPRLNLQPLVRVSPSVQGRSPPGPSSFMPSTSFPFLLNLFLQPCPGQFWVILPSRNLTPQPLSPPPPFLNRGQPRPWPGQATSRTTRALTTQSKEGPGGPQGTLSAALGAANKSPSWNSPLPLTQATLTTHQSHPPQGLSQPSPYLQLSTSRPAQLSLSKKARPPLHRPPRCVQSVTDLPQLSTTLGPHLLPTGPSHCPVLSLSPPNRPPPSQPQHQQGWPSKLLSGEDFNSSELASF